MYRIDRSTESWLDAERLARRGSGQYLRKGALVGLSFLVAFAIDRRTGQRHSNLLGGGAIAASMVTLWPWKRSILRDASGFAGMWLGFAVVRANAQRFGVSGLAPTTAAKLERVLFGGRLPSASLQRTLSTPATTRPLDVIAIAVHGSFFVVPASVGMALLRYDRQRFARYWQATAIMLALASASFVFWPTAPPWLHAPGEVRRVIVDTMQSTGIRLGSSEGSADADARALAFDLNPLAAMPSVHVAAAALVALACRERRPIVRLLGGAYGLAMSASVVYLGEHYVVDVLGGWLVAAIGWRAAGAVRTP